MTDPCLTLAAEVLEAETKLQQLRARLGPELRAARKRYGVRQKEFKTKNSVCSVERGEYLMPMWLLNEAAEVIEKEAGKR